MRLCYFSNCVGWPSEDVDAEGGLCEMIETRRKITRATFCLNVDKTSREDIERGLGYAVHAGKLLTAARDWAIQYFKGTLHGQTVYWMNQSAIEYVFTPGGILP